MPLFSRSSERKHHDRDPDIESLDGEVPLSPTSPPPGLDRGRAPESSGRGGAGNIGRTQSPDVRPPDGPDDFSVTRGREPVPAHHSGDRPVSTSRGGAGNIRPLSLSRDPSNARAGEYDAEKIRALDEANDTGLRTTGRGGAGNVLRSPSRPSSYSRERNPDRDHEHADRERSTSRGPVIRSTGRGGIGNLKTGEPTEVTILEVEDQERIEAGAADRERDGKGMHSTGRGGFANIRDGGAGSGIDQGTEGVVAHPREHGEFHSTGRGGAGNIRTRSGSREPGGSGGGRVAAFFHSLKGKDHDGEKVGQEDGLDGEGKAA